MRLINTMILPFAAILAFTACTKENTNDIAENNNAIRFVADQEITKTHFGEKNGDKYPTYWTGNESVAVALNYKESVDAAVTASADFKSASFTAVLADDESGSYSFCAVAPLVAFKDMSTSNKRIMIDIPSEQTPIAGSCDETAQVVAAYTEPVNAFPSEVSLNFKHLTAYGLLSINNLETGAVVSSIKMTSSISISSRTYWFPETGVLQAHPSKSESYINLTTNSVENVWFAIAPVDLSNTTMTIEVTTDKGVYSKSVTFPAGRTLISGHIAQMSFDFAGITPETENEPVDPIALYEVWKENDKAVGVVFWVAEDGNSAKIVSLDRTSTTVAWSTVGQTFLGADSKGDGASNTAILKASAEASSMPILSFCAEHGEGWYWPACNELLAIYEAKSYVEPALTLNGGDVLGTDQYWSSTEFNADYPLYAAHVKMENGYIGAPADQIKKTGATRRYGRCVKVVTR